MNRYLLKTNIILRVINTEERQLKKTERGNDAVFTGKLVKSLLIDGDPRLKKFFEKTSGKAPKLIHVTPLYVESSRIRCIHNFAEINETERYTFYVGFIDSETVESPSFDSIFSALMNINGQHRFRDRTLHAEILSVETIDVDDTAKNTVTSLVKTRKLRIIFASPTLLRDPFRDGKYKSLTPTPLNIFSTPVYINLYLTGELKQKPFIKTLIMLHRLLSEPYSIHRTTKIIKIKYDENKNPIPALIGYVNLYLNKDYYDKYKQRGVDIDNLLQETIKTILTLGTGTSRATGFGHINITTPKLPDPLREFLFSRNSAISF